ncbi:MAG: pyrroline-5-carboxylate reductase [Bacteroidales bacterium]
MKITIIGAGNMGGAIAKGLAQGSYFEEKDITVTARSQETLDQLKSGNPAFNVMNDNAEAVKGADIIVLAIKPWLLESVITQIRRGLDFKRQIILSVVAGVSFDDLIKMLTDNNEEDDEMINPVLFRVIPNTAIAIRESMTIISAYNSSDKQDALITGIFNEHGKAILIEEHLMGAATALCSCGIAYALKYIKSATDAGVELGFYPDQASDMISQTVKGAAQLLLTNHSMADTEIYKVTTPGGITIKGLNEMEAAGFPTAVRAGIKASVK